MRYVLIERGVLNASMLMIMSCWIEMFSFNNSELTIKCTIWVLISTKQRKKHSPQW